MGKGYCTLVYMGTSYLAMPRWMSGPASCQFDGTGIVSQAETSKAGSSKP